MSLEAEYEEKVADNIRDLLSLKDSTYSLFTFYELNEMIIFLYLNNIAAYVHIYTFTASA